MAKSATIGCAMRTRKGLALGLVLGAALVAVMLVLVATKPAGAAFPGSNGKIRNPVENMSTANGDRI
jgi:hypothetical protein